MQQEEINAKLESLGMRLKELRLEKGYTNYEMFAFKNDIPRAQYGRYEKGSDLKLSSLFKVAKALEVTMEELFKEFD
ncbi:MAG: helix-turn-helix transcriptional regulator [Cyclobacteriaceae bacterium]